MEELIQGIKETFNQILRRNIYEAGYSSKDTQNRAEQKKELRTALKQSVYGDRNSKLFIKENIKEILLRKYNVNSENISRYIAFGNRDKLSAQEKFFIILYGYKKKFKAKALELLIDEYNLDQVKYNKSGQPFYEISEEDVCRVYDNEDIYLTFPDKLEILTQIVYQNYKGNSVIDELTELKIDGISAGVSGIVENYTDYSNENNNRIFPKAYESIWIFYKGKNLRFSFLSFGSYKELVRVCKNIYRYNNPGQLSETRGYIVNEMADGSRVAVARPPFCESWVLFIRKFDNLLNDSINNIITDSNSILAVSLIEWLIKGCQVTAITGSQGSGKTTLLMSLIGYIPPIYTLRIQELSYELHLRRIYPERNIVTFRETESVPGQEGLDFQKKTDGTVNILGEVASAPVANWMICMSQVASLFTLFTHHAKTTEDLIVSLRNSLLLEGGFTNETAAAEQVIEAVDFDIHMKKNNDGHRYIERITEIVQLGNGIYETNDIIINEDGVYKLKNMISQKRIDIIKGSLNNEDLRRFEADILDWEEKS